MWDAFVEVLRAAIVAAAHVCGGSLGAGILFVAAGIRLALLPLTLRLARQARDQQAKLAALEPQLAALRKRYGNDHRKLGLEIRDLYRTHDIKLFTPAGLVSLAVQIPVFSGLFAAVRSGLGANVRFLWVADLARPESLLALAVTALTAASVSSASPQGAPSGMHTVLVAVTAIGTFAFLVSASSAMALSMGAGSLVSILQNLILARDGRRTPNAG